nr:phosphatase PAP2 family protein [Rhizobium sp. P38BS-XIX]
MLAVIAVSLLLIAAAFRQAIFIALAFAGAELLGNGIKPLIGRLRPDIVPHLVEASGESFPSGHSTLSSAVYLGLALLWSSRIASRNGRFACMTMAIFVTGLVGFSRIFLGVHFPSDVIGGWALGAGWTLLAWRFLAPGSSTKSGTLNR